MLDIFVLEIGMAILASLYMTGCSDMVNLKIQVFGFESSHSLKIVEPDFPLGRDMVWSVDRHLLTVQKRRNTLFRADILLRGVTRDGLLVRFEVPLTGDNQTYRYVKGDLSGYWW